MSYHYLKFVCALMLIALNARYAEASYKTIFTLGMGQGTTTVSGGIQSTTKANIISAAVDYQDDTTFLYLGGIAGTESEFDNLQIIVGGGTKHFKVGSGVIRMATRFPTESRSWGLFDSNPNFDTEASITGIPLFFRYTPLSDEKWQIHLDGYFTVASDGELKIPLFGSSRPNGVAYLQTDVLKTKSNYGSNFIMNYRINKDWAVQFRHQKEIAQFEDNDATIPGDPFSTINPTKVSAFKFKNEITSLNLVMLF